MGFPLEALIKKAVRAPSGHNTQPWIFKTCDNEITIYPDYSRALPVVDPDDHALFISLGCALENLIISARHFGFSIEITTNTEQTYKENITLHLSPTAGYSIDPLYDFIDVRQTTRNAFDQKSIPAREIEWLIATAVQPDVETIMLSTSSEIETIIEYVKDANRLQFANRDFKSELIKWIRFNKEAATKKGDGLFSATTGNPSVPTWIGKLYMQLASSPKKESEKCAALIRSSSAVMVFISARDYKSAWINVGRSFQRTVLTATSLGINHAHANMPCEEVDVRKALSRELNLRPTQQPLLLVRLGYSQKMPYSFRRPISDVMVK